MSVLDTKQKRRNEKTRKIGVLENDLRSRMGCPQATGLTEGRETSTASYVEGKRSAMLKLAAVGRQK